MQNKPRKPRKPKSPNRPPVKIVLRTVQTLPANATLWDSVVTGFGIRRQNSAAVAYVLMFRTAARRVRFYTIGRHGSPWTPESARREAVRLLGEVVQGRDPAATKREARTALTVSELCDRYLADAVAGRLLTRARRPKRASTLAKDRGRITLHIRPLLGKLPAASVSRRDVESFMHDVAAGKTSRRPGTALVARTVNLLGAIFTWALRQGLVPANPVTGVVRPADVRRTRRLSDLEYRQLGTSLDRLSLATKDWPPALAVARMLAVTGWRLGEVVGLKWSEVSLATRTAQLSETKTGASMRPLSQAACTIIRSMEPFRPRADPDDRFLGIVGSDLVFPAERTSAPMVAGFAKYWARLGLPRDISAHTMRHSFASLAADLGFSEPVIASLLGHRLGSMTSRYVHSADSVLLQAADKVAAETLRRMSTGPQSKTAEPSPSDIDLKDFGL